MEKIPIGNALQKLASDYEEDGAVVVKQEPESEPGPATRPGSPDLFGGFALKLEHESYSEEKKTVTDALVAGMGPAAAEPVAVRKKTSGGSKTCRARMEAFNVFEKAAARRRGGDANVKFGWYGGDREEIRRIVARGFSVGSASRNVVELLPFCACFGAASKCDVDQDGVRHLLLCRVVMGDTAPVRVMSKGSNTNIVIPDGADSGVDRVVNPRRYFMPTALMNSHIYPQYVVSFKAPNSTPLTASNGSVSCGLDAKLSGLKWGVVKTFKPTDAELVGGYLRNKIERGSEAFPELEIYGESGMEPWVIWNDFEAIKFPHQDYIYFFSRVKKFGKAGIRFTRRVGDGGTWSETEPAKSVSLEEGQNMQGKLRKFRYEHKDKNFNHHAEWLMDEYTLENSPSDLALCRIKMNDGSRGRKRNKIACAHQEDIEEFGSRKTKSLKLQNMESPHSDESIATSRSPVSRRK